MSWKSNKTAFGLSLLCTLLGEARKLPCEVYKIKDSWSVAFEAGKILNVGANAARGWKQTKSIERSSR